MVWTIASETFLGALRAAAATHLGPEHACVATIDKALESRLPADVAAVQETLQALPGDDIERILRAVHKTLREDPAAILGQWGGVGTRQ